MSAPKVYTIAEFSNEKYKFDILDNPGCKDTWIKLFEERQKDGLIGIINLGYFGLSGGGYASGCKIHGTWMCKPYYNAYGICIDENGNAFLGMGSEDNAYSYSEAVPAFLVNGKEMNRDQVWSNNGTTTLGFKNGNLVCMLCDKDNGQSTPEQIEAMLEYGCQTILRMDGSWSSHGRLGMGKVCQPSQMRKDRSYLLIYERNYNPPRTTKKVTLDPYGTATASTMFDICNEIKKALEEVEGIECMISRFRDNPDLTSSKRADQSDCWGADLVYSVLIGETSSTNKGVCGAWTNRTTSTAYKFATSIRDLMIEENIPVSDEIAVMPEDPILKETRACAALAVFVGDYSTPELRKTAVEVSVKAICKQLNVEYIPIYETTPPVTPPSTGGGTPEDINGAYDEETRKLFKQYVKSGLFPDNVTMGEVIRYGDLTKIIGKVLTSIDIPSTPDPDTGCDFSGEEFKQAVLGVVNEVIPTAETIVTAVDTAIADKGFATTEDLTTLAKTLSNGYTSDRLDDNMVLYNAANSFFNCIEKGLTTSIEKVENAVKPTEEEE